MTVTVNATATTPTQLASGTSTTNTTLTVAAGATALLAFLSAGTFSAAITSPSLTWDSGGTNQAMTLLGTITNAGVVSALFGLLSPTVGAKTLSASWTNASAAVLDAIAFNGTATDTIANAFKNAATNSGVSTTASVTGSSAVGNLNVAQIANLNGNGSTLTATGSTAIFSATTNSGGFGSYATGAATVAWTGTMASDTWAVICVDVAIPAAAANPPFTRWPQLGPLLAQ